ncbi:MAG TPA: L-threonylcarbamoyladenylate synthase [Patescibacteria group bacterium]|nr:L-threonylcarbamoyladenylate synthase [Patescibacteria group bacterium]
MIILAYSKKYHRQIVHACALALKQGLVVAYPTDTSYGLAADAGNPSAIQRLYRIKERQKNKPVHIVVPDLAYAKKIAGWSPAAAKLARAFWPGPLTLVLPLKARGNGGLKLLSAGSGFIGMRQPKNELAMALVRALGRPLTATSANPSARLSGGYDSYSARDIAAQFAGKPHRPDIVIDAGRLPRRRPSTLVRLSASGPEILRPGPVSSKQILNILQHA